MQVRGKSFGRDNEVLIIDSYRIERRYGPEPPIRQGPPLKCEIVLAPKSMISCTISSIQHRLCSDSLPAEPLKYSFGHQAKNNQNSNLGLHSKQNSTVTDVRELASPLAYTVPFDELGLAIRAIRHQHYQTSKCKSNQHVCESDVDTTHLRV